MIYQVAAIGAAVAAAVGVMSGGMMRPDASQFERPGQQLVSEEIAQTQAAPTVWPNGRVPDYVVGTDSLRPATMAYNGAAYRPMTDAELYGTTPAATLQPADWHAKADPRPARDDRSDAIRQAQHTSPPVTTPPENPRVPVSFPSIDGDTMGGLTKSRDAVTTVAPRALNTPKPLESVDNILGKLARDDAAAAKRIAARPS